MSRFLLVALSSCLFRRDRGGLRGEGEGGGERWGWGWKKKKTLRRELRTSSVLSLCSANWRRAERREVRRGETENREEEREGREEERKKITALRRELRELKCVKLALEQRRGGKEGKLKKNQPKDFFGGGRGLFSLVFERERGVTLREKKKKRERKKLIFLKDLERLTSILINRRISIIRKLIKRLAKN
jgi:hypothetical protein